MLRRFLLLFLLLPSGLAEAQDPQLSQFYAAPLYLNPAFAGSALAPRAILNYRNQWPALSANFVTTMFSVDHYIDRFNSGIGLLVVNDQQFSGLKSVSAALQYSYQLKITEDLALRAGFEAAFATRSADFYKLTFGDQLSNRGFTGSPTLDPVADLGPRIRYPDFSTGLLLYDQRFWAGVSVHHLNRPNQAFEVNRADPLPMKLGLQAGYKIPLFDYEIGNNLGDQIGREKSVSFATLYKKQGKFDQLDIGAYLTYAPLTFGVWYRGIPIKQYERGLNNHDAAIFLLGYRQDNFSFGYSYDATISSLGFASGGAHEISLAYTFPYEPERRPPYRKRKRELSCPKF
jgi:type IX secretion system PorP/SprF family membrane protein